MSGADQNSGDDVPFAAGETIRPVCSGRRDTDHAHREQCGGTAKIIERIGGA